MLFDIFPAILTAEGALFYYKLSEMAFILTGRPKYETAEKQKWISFETLLQMMWKIAEYHEENEQTAQAIAETQKALALIAALSDEEDIKNFQNYVGFFRKQIERMQKS